MTRPLRTSVVLGLAIITAVAGMGCKSTVYSGFMRDKKAVVVDRPMFELKGVRLSDSTVQFSFMTPSTLRTDDRSIRYVDVFVAPDQRTTPDSIMISPSIAGTPGVDKDVYFIGEGVWDTPAARSSQRAYATVGVVTTTNHIMFNTVVEYEKAEPLSLVPFVSASSDTTLDVGATARRIFVPEGEYLPTSEAFRVIISDGKGAVLWRSDAGMAFLSVVTLVEPQAANAVHRYEMPWDGRDLSGNRVPDGEYHADIIIPARPKPYATSTTVKWPPR